ncbi:MAG: hypothetical protein IPP47_30505 [Bryobacterales bacterium]|nr:hypothetical protein [Bryobacterales bacterium]
MTRTESTMSLNQASESADFAGVLARTSDDLLNSAYEELMALLRDLDARHPLRSRLGEIRFALQSARDLNRQLVHCLSLVALHSTLDQPARSSSWGQRQQGMRPVAQTPEPAKVALVVESNDGLRRLMGEVARKQGYQVLEARTAEEAERIAGETVLPVERLVTEVFVAGASGVALGSRLRQLQPQMSVIYTVCEAHEAVLPPGALGEATVLRKPFTVAGLTDALRGARNE